MYGRLPVCMRRWRAKLDDFLPAHSVSISGLFCAFFENVQENSYIRKCLATIFMVADMRLFACMRPRMDGQSTSLNEAFVAAGYCTMIWTFIRVYSVMPAQVRLAIK